MFQNGHWTFLSSENANSQKLIAEYEKYQDLQARSQRLQEDYERKLEEKEDAMEKALQKLTEHFEVQLWERAKELEQVWQAKTFNTCTHLHIQSLHNSYI